MSIDTPCIDLCGLDRRSGWCRGCGRTAPEIRTWQKMHPGERKTVMKDLKRRLQRLEGQGRARSGIEPALDRGDERPTIDDVGDVNGLSRATA